MGFIIMQKPCVANVLDMNDLSNRAVDSICCSITVGRAWASVRLSPGEAHYFEEGIEIKPSASLDSAGIIPWPSTAVARQLHPWKCANQGRANQMH